MEYEIVLLKSLAERREWLHWLRFSRR